MDLEILVYDKRDEKLLEILYSHASLNYIFQKEEKNYHSLFSRVRSRLDEL